jgi:hypothetical protein
MYGVVVCPRCKRAKGVDAKQRTTTCVCGFEIHVFPNRMRARTERAADLADLVGRVNAEISGGLKTYEADLAPRRQARSRDVYTRVIAMAAKAGDRSARIRSAASELTRELEVFTLDDWSRVLAGLGVPNPEGALGILVAASAVFEPRTGFYRALELTP